MPDSMSQAAEAPIAVEDAPTPEKSHDRRTSNKPKREPNYHVIIWNDEEHSYDYVIEMLITLFAYDIEKAFTITDNVHKTGKGIAWTGHLELAELKRDQILSFGPDPRMPQVSKSSIRATIEPAPE